MIYAQFLLVILLPLVIAAASFLVLRLRRSGCVNRAAPPRSIAVLALVLPLLALIYTTPWDSWLIRNSVWGYPPGTIFGTVFGVPLEEYTFMVGTTVLTGCWTLAVAVDRTPGSARSAGNATPAGSLCAADPGHVRHRVRAATFWLTAVVVGAAGAAVEPHALYGGSQLAWFGLPLALQAACGADVLRASWRLRLAGLATTPVLWAADAVGIQAGAWFIGKDSTVGLELLGVLPLEEATFFLLVNLLVVNSVVLCLDPLMSRRTGRFRAGFTRSRPGTDATRPADARPPDPHASADRLSPRRVVPHERTGGPESDMAKQGRRGGGSR
jgi:lycopene cyclase domain-containing protein